MATDGTASLNSLLMFTWHTARKIERTKFQRFAANVEHSCISCSVVLACLLSRGKHSGLQAWDVTPKTVRMCSFDTFSAGASRCPPGPSRCLCASQPMQYATRLPLFLIKGNYLLFFPELCTNFPETISQIPRNYLLNFPEL